MRGLRVLRVPPDGGGYRLLLTKRLRVGVLGAPLRALPLDLAGNLLERWPVRWDVVPARADDVDELDVDEIGRRKRGPLVLI